MGCARSIARHGGRSLPRTQGWYVLFLLADTAWHLRTLSESQIDAYLRDRADKQFNVVMADFRRGLKPQDDAGAESHWVKNDYIVDQAAKRGLYVVVIAGWGSTFKHLSAKQMHDYGRQLGTRYKERPNVIYFVAAEFYKIKGRSRWQASHAVSAGMPCRAGARASDVGSEPLDFHSRFPG